MQNGYVYLLRKLQIMEMEMFNAIILTLIDSKRTTALNHDRVESTGIIEF